MNVIVSLLRSFRFCRHRNLYRERRDLHGVDVLHLVCDSCGYAVPAVQRSADEHQRVVVEGAVRPLAVRRESRVVALDSRRGASCQEPQRRRA